MAMESRSGTNWVPRPVSTNHYDPKIKWPHTNEFSGEIEQQLPGQLVVSLGYYFRGLRDQIGSTNLAVPMSGYTPIAVTEVTSGRVVTVYNQDPATKGKFNTLWSNLPQSLDGDGGLSFGPE